MAISKSTIEAFVNKLEKARVPMHALLLMQGDELIAEGYYAPFKKGELHRMFSIAKSINALAIGILEAEGKLKLSDPIANFFPDKVPTDVHPFVSSMTIEDLLMMRTCHAATTYQKINPTVEWVESFFITPPTHKPGTVFHYDTSAAHTLGMLVKRLTGQDSLSFLKDKALREIGWSEDSYIMPNDFGDPHGGSGLMCTPMDLLLLGKLLLQEGNWKGKQLLPKEYVKKACSNLSPTVVTGPIPSEMQGYGYQIWTGEHDSFVLYGMGGQLALCHPKYNLVCVTCADTQGFGGGNQFIYDSFYETVLAELEDEVTGIDLSTSSAYSKQVPKQYPDSTTERVSWNGTTIEGLQVLPVCKFVTSKEAYTCSKDICQTFHFESNKNDYQWMNLEFDATSQTGTLKYSKKDIECSIPFGIQSCATSTFPLYDWKCATSAVWLDENTLFIKTYLIDSAVGSVSFELYFGTSVDSAKDLTVFIKKVEETMLAEYNTHLYGKEQA